MTGLYAGQSVVLALIGAALIANAFSVDWAVRFCADCQRTLYRAGNAPRRCAECLVKQGKA